MSSNGEKVIVALSGGVDSSTSVFLLREKGYEPIGVYLKMNDNSEAAELAASNVAKHLVIPFHVIDARKEFEGQVIKYFLESYEHGLTPNPCVKCNKEIKFNLLIDLLGKFGAEYIATGHYAVISKDDTGNNGNFILQKAVDPNKDQSYFLYKLTQRELAKLIFPLGKINKDEVRKIADNEKIPYIKEESQDICFLSENGKSVAHNEFLKKHLKMQNGPIKTLDGETVGEHQGLPLYTIGQRKGIEIGGIGPFYAASMDFETNTLYVVKNFDDERLKKCEFAASDFNWIAGNAPKFSVKCEAVIRYRHPGIPCTVSKIDRKHLKIILETPQRAVTPGQSVVLFDMDRVLGGGIIN